MNGKQPFAELLAGLQQGKLSLVDIIQSLNARGPVQAPLHRAELGMLDDALGKKKIDEKQHRLLTAKLKDVQGRGREDRLPPGLPSARRQRGQDRGRGHGRGEDRHQPGG
jgi:hypothetical protein